MSPVGPGLGKRLTAAGLVDRGRLGAALALTTAEPMSLAEALTRIGVDPELIARIAQNSTGTTRATKARLAEASPEVIASLPPTFIRRRLAVPVALEDGVLVVACADPLDPSCVDEASRLARRAVRPEVASVPDLLSAIRARHPDVPLPKARPTFVLGNRASGAVPFAGEAATNVRANAPVPRPSMPPQRDAATASEATPLTESQVVTLPESELDDFMRWDVGPTRRRPRVSQPAPETAPVGANTRRKLDRDVRATLTPIEDLGGIVSAIRAAPSRDRVLELVLAASIRHARQAFVFRTRENKVEGVDSAGSSLGAVAVRRIVLPISSGSTLHRVLVEGQPHLGPLGVVATDQVLRVAIGSRGGRLSMHGIWIDGRAVAMLVADDVRTAELGHERLGAVCHAAGLALKRLLRDRG